MKLHKIETENFKLDGGAMFGVVPKTLWQKRYPADENNLCSFAMRCLLIEIRDRKILVDTGLGNKQDEKFLRHYYLHGNDSLEKSLHKINLSFDDITDVLLTHLHFDHCGGAIKYAADNKSLIPAFANATYWISQKQWNWATNPNPRERASFLKENILPIKDSGQLKLFANRGETEVNELFPDVDIRIFDGHTEGQAIPMIKYNGKTIVFMADVLPTVAAAPVAWVMSYDTQPLITMNERQQFWKEAAENDYVLFLEHDIFNECCKIGINKKGRYDVVETFNFDCVL